MKHTLFLITLTACSLITASSNNAMKTNLFDACKDNNIHDLKKGLRYAYKNNINPLSLRKNGKNLLHCAVQHSQKDLCKLLIKKYEFSPQTKTLYGKNTALHLAAKRGNLTIVKTLIRNDGFSAKKNKYGRSPVEIALLKGHIDIANAILDYGEIHGLSGMLVIKESVIDSILDNAVSKGIVMPTDTIHRISKKSLRNSNE